MEKHGLISKKALEGRANHQAFLSYAHADDDYLGGMISRLRTELQKAVKFVTGRSFAIFQDKDGIRWGEAWEGRLDQAISEASFLIPILTPSFFSSIPCCDEIKLFREFEAEAGRDDLILPIYLQAADVFDDETLRAESEVASLLFERQFRCWPKELIHEPTSNPGWQRAVHGLAEEIHRISKKIDADREGWSRADRLRAEELAADLSANVEANAGSDPLAKAKSLAADLAKEAKKKQNSLPEAFPFRSLEDCLTGLLMLLAGGSDAVRDGDSICDLGEQARFLLDFALALRDQPFAERPELEALQPLLENLLALLGKKDGLPLMESDPAPWPEGAQAAVRELLGAIKDELDDASSDVDDAEQRHLNNARYHHSVLSRESHRDRPKWPSLCRSGQMLDSSLQAVAAATFSELQELTGRLAETLRDTANLVIRGLPEFAVFQDLPDAPVMVIIPPGGFDMGSMEGEGHDDERPQHRVTIERRFALGRYPVILENYAPFVAATGHEGKGAYIWKEGDVEHDENADWRSPGFEQTPRHPVVCVSWDDTQAFVAWLCERSGADYRLPSEAIWEFACRAGTTTAYSFGDEFSHRFAHGSVTSHDDVENIDDIPNVDDVGRTAKVGTYPANPWQLCDMHGNVWEWIEDRWHDSYEGAPTDGSAWIEGKNPYRVLRGGSCFSFPVLLRSAYRDWDNPDFRNLAVGFRVSRTLTP